ncbi:NAD(P)H-dependent glycerol-3-phosphate dehydrogenase [Mycoplasma buteonis]|uniref:NAD(P)H-dependent glycerol-3-phosphate dehydrogenase n=1 Tax=Mycoplasma buteonis TaxID=171280 RepID=UPI00055B3610|nr:NAD(P)H-dependent glycerol-3-phosphate dehydrogenase [Mycoplasma buteonis]
MKKAKKFGFIGTGAWSSALANVLSENGYESMLYGIDKNEIDDINSGYNKKYFNSRMFVNPENIKATNSLEEVLKFANVIVLGVPSHIVRSVLKDMQDILKYKKIDLVNLSKGIEPSSELFFSEFIKKKFKKNLKNLATFIGPSFASEVFNNKLTMINVTGDNADYIEMLCGHFNNNKFKIVPNFNTKGTEIFAALKNVLAIGMGIVSYQDDSRNTHAALLSMGLREIVKVYQRLCPGESNSPVALDFAGVGDTVLTCSSFQSRNYTFGKDVAEFGIDVAVERNATTVEGYQTAKTLEKIIRKKDIDVPLFKNIIQVLFKHKNPFKILDFLK